MVLVQTTNFFEKIHLRIRHLPTNTQAAATTFNPCFRPERRLKKCFQQSLFRPGPKTVCIRKVKVQSNHK